MGLEVGTSGQAADVWCAHSRTLGHAIAISGLNGIHRPWNHFDIIKEPPKPGIIFSQKSVSSTSEDTKWHAVRCLQTSWRPTFFLSLVPVAMAGASRQQYLLQGSSAAWLPKAAWPLIFQVMMMAAGCFSVLDLEFQAWIFFVPKGVVGHFFMANQPTPPDVPPPRNLK